jgi:hypothetical protein
MTTAESPLVADEDLYNLSLNLKLSRDKRNSIDGENTSNDIGRGLQAI